jgi:hypothetical protein
MSAARSTGWRSSSSQSNRSKVVFLSDGISYARLGEQWVERFCDPLIQALKMRDVEAELWSSAHAHRRGYLTEPRFIQSRLDFANIRGVLLGRLPAAVSLPMHEDVLGWMSQQGWGSTGLSREAIASDASRLRSLAEAYKVLLRRSKPRIAFLVSYYGLEGMAFVLACRECGILSVDLQHGVQGDCHPAYASWCGSDERALQLLPDCFWVWSRWESDVITRWSSQTPHFALIGGNHWATVWDGPGTWPGVGAAVSRAQALKERAGRKPVVLVTLQYGLNDSEQSVPVVRMAQDNRERFVFWVRLHPMMSQQRDKIRNELGEFAEVDEPSDIPLHALLPHVDVHVTHSSSVVIEASQSGIRSVITSKFGEELFPPLYEQGWARTEIRGGADLAAVLASEASAKVPRSRQHASSLDEPLSKLLAISESLGKLP